jgi:hypothetical protein
MVDLATPATAGCMRWLLVRRSRRDGELRTRLPHPGSRRGAHQPPAHPVSWPRQRQAPPSQPPHHPSTPPHHPMADHATVTTPS